MLTGFAHKLGQIIVESGTRVGMAVGLGLLVVVSELDNYEVARLHLLQHLVPASLVDERERGAAIHGVVVNDDVVVEVA